MVLESNFTCDVFKLAKQIINDPKMMPIQLTTY